MTPDPLRDERAASQPLTGLDRLAAYFLPWFYPDPRACDPCVDHDHVSPHREAEHDLELDL